MKDPMRRPGDLGRDPEPDRPHDPRRRRRGNIERGPSGSGKDFEKPAGDEGVGPRRDDIVRPNPKAKAPIPGLPHPGDAPAAD